MSDSSRLMRPPNTYLAAVILAALPVYFLVCAIQFKHARGPYFYTYNNDPTYVYLTAGLNLAQGKFAGYCMHPGTPTEVATAVVLRVYHFFAGKGDLVNDVLSRPETYLLATQRVLLGLTVALNYGLGWVAWLVFRNFWAGLFAQAGLIFSVTFMPPISAVNAETTVLPLGLLFAVSLLWSCTKTAVGTTSFDEKPARWFAWWGVIVGLLVAAKITSAPLAFLPLFLLTRSTAIRLGMLYVLACAASFLVACLPVLPDWNYMFGWLTGVATHDGIYGGGKVGVPSFKFILGNFLDLVSHEYLFNRVWIYGFLVTIAASIRHFSYRKTTGHGLIAQDLLALRILIGTLFVQFLTYVMVAKHPDAHYAIPALTLMGLNGALATHLVFSLIGTWRPQWHAAASVLAMVMLAGALWVHTEKKYKHQKKVNLMRGAQAKLLDELPVEVKQGKVTVIHPMFFASIEQAYDFGSQYNHGDYAKELREHFPNALIFRQASYYKHCPGSTQWAGKENVLAHYDRELSMEDILARLKAGPVYVFLTEGWDLPVIPGVTWELVIKHELSALYVAKR